MNRLSAKRQSSPQYISAAVGSENVVHRDAMLSTESRHKLWTTGVMGCLCSGPTQMRRGLL